MNLDENFLKLVKSAIINVWQDIGCEVSDADNLEALELCIDAQRIAVIAGNQEAQDAVYAACEEHGIDKVYEYLNSKILLVY